MSQQNQNGTTFTLRITETGGTFRCRATGYNDSKTYMRSTFDTSESQPQSIQNPGVSKLKQLSRSNRVTAQQQSAGSFRIGVSTATFRMAG